MDPLVPFTLPVKGLSHGIHSFTFEIGKDFFEQFEDPLIEDGVFVVGLELDKRIDMLILDFSFQGKAFTSCDRCLAAIKLPVSGENRLLVKFGQEEPEEDDDVIFLETETHQLNVARYVYEFVCLALPMIKVYNCQDDVPPPCDFDMLAYLKPQAEPEPEENNPFKDVFKNLNKPAGNSFPE